MLAFSGDGLFSHPVISKEQAGLLWVLWTLVKNGFSGWNLGFSPLLMDMVGGFVPECEVTSFLIVSQLDPGCHILDIALLKQKPAVLNALECYGFCGHY